MIKATTMIVAAAMAVLTIALPRKYFLLPFVILACFIPAGQRIIIMGLDFTPLRICVVFGVLRIFMRGENMGFRWNIIDKMVFSWAVCGALIYVLQWGDMRAVIYKCGVLFDVLGLFWLFRQNIRSWESIDTVIDLFAICALISVLFVIYERVTHKNPFEVFGTVETGFHRGRYRCRGAFPHSIMLGLFWLNFIPMFFAYSLKKHSQKLYWWSAIAASVVIVFLTGSSTPISALVCVGLFIALFYYRQYGWTITWSILGVTAVLHVIRSKPVWHLISRIRFISGSTGWHRYNLIDQTIKHFGEWVFLGTRSTSHWGYGLFDITNQYCLEGVRGGLITLGLFIILLVIAVKTVGSYSLRRMSIDNQWLSWGICVSVLSHCVSFFGVSYFGQIIMVLYLTFAFVSMICDMSNNVL